MAIPAIPQGFYLTQGNGQVFLSWSITTGATSYYVFRSTDGVNFSSVSSSSAISYLDTSVSVGTQYYYKVASINASGSSSFTSAQAVIPALQGQMSLGEVRLRAQQRADMVNSNFITTPEWNYYINQSYYELYDLLITAYEDYYVAPALQFTTDGSSQYDLPTGANYDGAPAFYKMFGMDCGLNSNNNAFATLKKFDFISRNRYVFPQITTTLLGVFNLQYRVVGGKLMFIPTPSAGQIVRMWYYPRLDTLLQDTDIMDGISGWSEYVIVDAAIKALRKEESDTQELTVEKMMLKTRIEETASNRDAGQPDTISNTATWSNRWGGWGGDMGGPTGGF